MKPIAFDCTLSVHRDCSVQDSKLKVLGVISTSSALSLSGGSSTVLSQIGGGGSLQMTVVFSVKMRCSTWAIQAATNASQSFQILFLVRRICDKGVPVGGKMEPNSIASTRQRESEFFNTCLTLPHACFSLTFRHLKVYFLMLLQPSVYGIHRIVKEQPHEAI
ncbi:2-isopropylmalate synthase [Trichinella spiralis]|uniref:2-isopropylmalate synthase n=1 Tax=Trichinella spiralis TaxID=6334 RepID=A0ABR3KLM9_TRISP